MNFLQSLFYGFLSGISECMPVSSNGHQALLRKLFGTRLWNPLLDLMVHIGILVAIFVSCRARLLGYARELSGNPRRRRRNPTNIQRTYDLRFLFSAGIALLAVLLFHRATSDLEQNSLLLCLFFIINGTVLYVVDHMRHGNKDSSQMSGLDAVLTGLLGGLSIFPGISRLGMCLSASVARGADKSQAYSWALLLCIPALLFLILFDFIGLFTAAGFAFTFLGFVYAFVAALGAFTGGYLVILLMRLMIVNTGFSGYACYCWGVAMLTFILYLIA